jgi:hypothetical protein
MMLSVTKTDAKDAKLIALFGQRMHPQIYRLPSQLLLQLKHKRTLYRPLKKQLVALLNTAHSFASSPYVDESTHKILNKCIDNLQQQLTKLKTEMIHLAESDYEHLLKRVTSVAGVGKHRPDVVSTSDLLATALIEITCRSRLKPVVRLASRIFPVLKNSLALLDYVLVSINQVNP